MPDLVELFVCLAMSTWPNWIWRINKEQSLDFLYSLDLRVFVLNHFIDTDDIYFFMMDAHTEVVGR